MINQEMLKEDENDIFMGQHLKVKKIPVENVDSYIFKYTFAISHKKIPNSRIGLLRTLGILLHGLEGPYEATGFQVEMYTDQLIVVRFLNDECYREIYKEMIAILNFYDAYIDMSERYWTSYEHWYTISKETRQKSFEEIKESVQRKRISKIWKDSNLLDYGLKPPVNDYLGLDTSMTIIDDMLDLDHLTDQKGEIV